MLDEASTFVLDEARWAMSDGDIERALCFGLPASDPIVTSFKADWLEVVFCSDVQLAPLPKHGLFKYT